MKLYDHQKKIIDADPKKCGLFLGTGSGKTRIALRLARGKTLVICPKTQKEDQNWERENKSLDDGFMIPPKNLVVMSKETFRRDFASLPKFDTVIVDEAHTCLGVTPSTRQRKKVVIPRASQLFEALETYLYMHKPERLYLATATIMRSPMTVWGAAKILGHTADFYTFRHNFYTKLPMPGREVWAPKKDDVTKDKLAQVVRLLGYVGRLEDYFDVPDQTYRTTYVEMTAEQKARIKDMNVEFPEPIVRLGKRHQIENGVLAGDEFSPQESFNNEKEKVLLELALEFPRMVLFVKYTYQIKILEERFREEGYKVLTLTGATKERGSVIKEANDSKECIFIAQAQISAGWELPEYPVMVFVSRTYSFVDYDQAVGRIQRANNIKKNLYINLVTRGGVDEQVDKCLEMKQDFNERLYLNL